MHDVLSAWHSPEYHRYGLSEFRTVLVTRSIREGDFDYDSSTDIVMMYENPDACGLLP